MTKKKATEGPWRVIKVVRTKVEERTYETSEEALNAAESYKRLRPGESYTVALVSLPLSD